MKFFNWRLWYSVDFLKTLKVQKLVWPWRLGIHFWNRKREDFCFRSFIFSFLRNRKHRTVKGGRGNTKETNFQVMLISKSYTYPILRVKPLEISYQFSQFLQWQRRRSSGLWGICSDWRVRNSPVRIAYTVRNMIALRNSNLKSDRCCAARELSQNILPPNGHIRQRHLCLIMSGCSLGYK